MLVKTMSSATKSALDEAVAAHIHDVTEGGIVTGYVMQTSYFSTSTEESGSTGYYVEVADDQSFHIGLGLSQMLRFHYDSLFYGNDDDD